MDSSLFGEALKAIVTWALVVYGWIVVNEQQNERELRKVAIERLSKLPDRLDEIESLAIQHHTAGYDEARARTILRSLKRLSIEISHCQTCGYIDSQWIGSFVDLRKSITGKNFDSGSYSKKGLADPLVGEIEVALDKVRGDMLRNTRATIGRKKGFLEIVLNFRSSR